MTTTPPPPATRLGIAIDLGALEALMKIYLAECVDKDEQLLEEVRLSTFIAWLSKRQRESSDSNILTFRVEKEAGD
jgi:hypothetical protein